jgi:hypothetical protein
MTHQPHTLPKTHTPPHQTNLQVDLQTMREVGAIVTPPGCTWLYAAAVNRGFGFFGSRYHETSVVARMGLRIAKPDVPRTPEGNATGQDAILLSWQRDFPRYHTGGAEIVGARVLVRPAWHWDWTAEHVYGRAAPDPYAPKEGAGRIVRVHVSCLCSMCMCAVGAM